jgi:hypothetical protein
LPLDVASNSTVFGFLLLISLATPLSAGFLRKSLRSAFVDQERTAVMRAGAVTLKSWTPQTFPPADTLPLKSKVEAFARGVRGFGTTSVATTRSVTSAARVLLIGPFSYQLSPSTPSSAGDKLSLSVGSP